MLKWTRYTIAVALFVTTAGVFMAGQVAGNTAPASAFLVAPAGGVAATQPFTQPAAGAKSATTRPANAATRPAATRPAAATTRPADSKVIAYYFHRKLRCPTCLRIEELSKQAVETGFAGEMSLGTVEWRSVNIDEKANAHFEKDYRLQFQSLVLVKMAGGKRIEWQNLEKVWDLVGDPTEFVKYVQNGLHGKLYGKAAGRLAE